MDGKAVVTPELMPVISVPVALTFRGRHTPVRRVDKTVTGLPGQAPVGSDALVRPRTRRPCRRAGKSRTGQSMKSVSK